MDKTYAEEIGAKAFDWEMALTKAIKSKPSFDRAKALALLSAEWVTCACGNQCAAIPRESNGRPKDDALRDLGCLFHHNIVGRKWRRALQALKLIEARSAILLDEKGRKAGIRSRAGHFGASS